VSLRAKVGEWLYSKSAGWAGRLIQDKRFVGERSELADLAVAAEVCLAMN
jgi:hypothetical protein